LRNSDLLRDLKDIDRLARKAHADKEYTIEAADRELNEAKVKGKRKIEFYFYIHLIVDRNST
jgi:hypothetical protein